MHIFYLIVAMLDLITLFTMILILSYLYYNGIEDENIPNSKKNSHSNFFLTFY